MKIKNIMFSGVMASILMAGGAYAAYPDTSTADSALATAGFVRGAYREGVKTAVDNVQTDENSGISIEYDGEDAGRTATISVDTSVIATKESVDAKQDALKPGSNISIAKNAQDELEISATYGTGNATTAGITKLYDTTGTATDGTMTQGAIKTALDGKQDVITSTNTLNAEFVGTDTTHRFVTDEEKTTWNAKQAALTTAQVDAVNSGITEAKVGDYEEHLADADIHVTAEQKTTWTGKQDALDTGQLAAVNSGITAAKVTKYDGYEAAINGKANPATTLAGYGITDAYTKAEVNTELDKKQDKLTQAANGGTNISITNGVITATDTTYTAGNGVSIDASNNNAVAVKAANDSISVTSDGIALGYAVTSTTFSASAGM